MLLVLEELDISLITSSDSTWILAVGMSLNVTLQSSLAGKQMWRHADAILQYVRPLHDLVGFADGGVASQLDRSGSCLHCCLKSCGGRCMAVG